MNCPECEEPIRGTECFWCEESARKISDLPTFKGIHSRKPNGELPPILGGAVVERVGFHGRMEERRNEQ